MVPFPASGSLWTVLQIAQLIVRVVQQQAVYAASRNGNGCPFEWKLKIDICLYSVPGMTSEGLEDALSTIHQRSVVIGQSH